MWNFSMMFTDDRSTYLMVSISIWDKQEVYNMLSKILELFLQLSDFVFFLSNCAICWYLLKFMTFVEIMMCIGWSAMVLNGTDWVSLQITLAPGIARKARWGGRGRPPVAYQERPGMRSLMNYWFVEHIPVVLYTSLLNLFFRWTRESG